ncbi:hypothetical protein BD289DRAFT_262822 [Coniella lustricola]|uniref:Uncharacterized protein n=1 Tax=Coniella lustricola TaxID=2025994 RepID=A0A2T3A7F9_9PEZI|nr:hypothetical protein BD289DRAFT_262822 [Coniella lustricola]
MHLFPLFFSLHVEKTAAILFWIGSLLFCFSFLFILPLHLIDIGTSGSPLDKAPFTTFYQDQESKTAIEKKVPSGTCLFWPSFFYYYYFFYHL